MNEVANSIKRLRQERQLSQEQLVEQLHVTRQDVSNWEMGKHSQMSMHSHSYHEYSMFLLNA